MIGDNSNHFTLIYIVKNIILNNLPYNLISDMVFEIFANNSCYYIEFYICSYIIFISISY